MTAVVAIVDYHDAIKLLDATIARMQGEGARDLGAFIAKKLQEESERAFASHVDPTSGTPWAGLDAATLASRKRLGLGAEPLQRSGGLRSALYAAYGVSARKAGEGKIWGLGILPSEYAKIGQALFYGSKGKRAIPSRRFMGLSAGTIRAIEDYGAGFFAGAS